MIDSAENRPLAVLLWRTDERGEDDVACLVGPLRRGESGWYVERDDGPPFELLDEWLQRVRETPAGAREIVGGAPFLLSLSVGSGAELQAGEGRASGLRWHAS